MKNSYHKYLLPFILLFPILSSAQSKYAEHSVLRQGKWYKIAVREDNIYRLDAKDFEEMGFQLSDTPSSHIKIYGNCKSILSESIENNNPDDLQQLSIYVNDHGDGFFDDNDYVLFFAKGSTAWTYNESTQLYEHQHNHYSDKSHYFVTINNQEAKRIASADEVSGNSAYVVDRFTDYKVHELDKFNLIGSGRNWFGEKFDFETEYDFAFDFPNCISGMHTISTGIASRSLNTSTYTVTVENESYQHSIFPILNNQKSNYANTSYLNYSFSGSENIIDVKIKNNDASGNTIGWIDYVALNVNRAIKIHDNSIYFHSPHEKIGEVVKIDVQGANANTTVWDLSDPVNPTRIIGNLSGSDYFFNYDCQDIHYFIAFNSHSFAKPELISSVPNQDLHGTRDVDYIIISHPDFIDNALAIADLHYQDKNLAYNIVTPQEIYNEFSSGNQDISAIRDYLKMVYETRDNQDQLLYVLFFGDASYDYKDILNENTNLIPTWESPQSLHPLYSFATDDFFGKLDTLAGDENIIDIGMGRLPVSSKKEADELTDKILKYNSKSPEVMDDWRNIIAFVADDEQGNSHTSRADQLANYIEAYFPGYNIDKIYIDAYEQISSPSGQRYPDVNQAIEDRIKNGALIINYTGHGGEDGWAEEKILNVTDINNWNNSNHFPVFVTATCEFSRFDDPKRVSAGEYTLLNPHGGGIALFTTTRATYGSPNQYLNLSFYEHALNKNADGKYYRLGDIIRLAKKEVDGDSNSQKFILLGDPATEIAHPEYDVVTTNIRNLSTETNLDTLRALQEIRIEGEIQNNDLVINDFNGVVQVKIYDKETEVETRGNDNTTPYIFKQRKSILYNGSAAVENGKFTLDFIVPKDISYKFGQGKVSYYATDGVHDASGYDNSIIIGGFDDENINDNQGPKVSLYINDQFFEDGGICNENPILFAKMEDQSGINTIGTGIGHDITLSMGEQESNTIILNEFYKAELGNFKKGSLVYPFYNLENGDYELHLKVWDNNNNSTDAVLNFTVSDATELKLKNIYNYPNPFKNTTTIVYEHNQADQEINSELQIFDIYGKLVHKQVQSSSSKGFVINNITWDGRSADGSKLHTGIYVYRIIATMKNKKTTSKTGKLILIK